MKHSEKNTSKATKRAWIWSLEPRVRFQALRDKIIIDIEQRTQDGGPHKKGLWRENGVTPQYIFARELLAREI